MGFPYQGPEFLGKRKSPSQTGRTLSVDLVQLGGYSAAGRAAPTATVRCLAFLDSATGRAMVKTPFS